MHECTGHTETYRGVWGALGAGGSDDVGRPMNAACSARGRTKLVAELIYRSKAGCWCTRASGPLLLLFASAASSQEAVGTRPRSQPSLGRMEAGLRRLRAVSSGRWAARQHGRRAPRGKAKKPMGRYGLGAWSSQLIGAASSRWPLELCFLG